MNRTILGVGLGVGSVLLVIGTSWVIAAENLPDQDENMPAEKTNTTEQYSYAIGLDMGTSFRSSETPLDVESLVAGLQAGLDGAEPKYDAATCGNALQQLQILMSNKAMAEQQEAGAENRKLGEQFLAQNKTKEGVQVTASGLQYKVLEAGTGATPKLSDTVRCNYRGLLIDGQEFDASANHGGPATFPVQGVIPGWTEALQLMKVGAKWQLFIPAELAYGDQQRGPVITPGSTLVFDIELVGIEGQ
jgi:FKBP-type peptidyl-prolyl cis-trans isomerase FklB